MTGQPRAPRVHLWLDPPLLADVVALALAGAGIPVGPRGPVDGVVVTNGQLLPPEATAVVRVVDRPVGNSPVAQVDDGVAVAGTLAELVAALRGLLQGAG